MWFWMLWLVALTAAITLYFRKVFSRFKKAGVRHFTPLPIFGNQLDIILRQYHFTELIERTYFAFPQNKFVGHFDFVMPSVILRDIDLIKKVTVKDFEHFVDHRVFIDDKVDPLFGRNLFSMTGDEWKDMRSTLSPAFTSSKIRVMVPFMVEVGDQMMRALKNKIKNSNLDYVDVECKDLSTRYANDVIASCAFGLKVDSHSDVDNEFYRMGKTASDFGFKFFLKIILTNCLPKVAKFFKVTLFSDEVKFFFQDLVLDTMKNRDVHKIFRPDMIHLLMEAKKEYGLLSVALSLAHGMIFLGRLTHDEKTTHDTDAGFATVEESTVGKKSIDRAWTDVDLIAQAVLFFVAGFETVSTAMTFLLYELAVNPDIQERLYQEIMDNERNNDFKFDYNSVQKMTYLDMVVSELLRLWPPAISLDRKCVKPYNFGRANALSTEDYIIKQGEGVNIPVWAIHRDSDFYPDPLRFDPERFSDENKHKINPWTYMPFGTGPRNCIGSRFALCEVKVMAYQLLRHMELLPCDRTCIPARLAPEEFNFRLKGGAWIRMRDRSQ